MAKFDELCKYLQYDYDEYSDLCEALLGLYERGPDYYDDDTFYKALEKELKAKEKYYQEHAIIVEEEVKTIRVERYLKWKS